METSLDGESFSCNSSQIWGFKLEHCKPKSFKVCWQIIDPEEDETSVSGVPVDRVGRREAEVKAPASRGRTTCGDL